MASATPVASARGKSTSAFEERSVRGCRRHAAWPPVADAVIEAVSHIDLPECIRLRAFCGLIHSGRQQDVERGAVVPVRNDTTLGQGLGSAATHARRQRLRSWRRPYPAVSVRRKSTSLSKEQGVQGLRPLCCVAESGGRGDQGPLFSPRHREPTPIAPAAGQPRRPASRLQDGSRADHAGAG